MNKLVLVGYEGQKRAYLNVAKEEAIQRYLESEFIGNIDCEPFVAQILKSVEEFEFTDEFGVYAAWNL